MREFRLFCLFLTSEKKLLIQLEKGSNYILNTSVFISFEDAIGTIGNDITIYH